MAAPLTPVDGGTLLDLEVVPGAQADAFPAGYNPWRERVQARVQAPARDGQANEALCHLVAQHFSLDPKAVELVKGHASRRKTVRLAGVGPETARAALREVLP